ncbi:DNA repair protein RadA [Fervidobacterium thailandense]|uniref:DNA repair protein RadA n=1 Tax=Fervidobacterium thailandense TaxID=1008305 RepID=A0A1E3G3S1_9BACT|nr:DNA repair protein RadA [Fervidobacterium thailandense]ODN30921.1 DNA repair protein RadA [Fervidobacterium thailandense]
MPKQKVVYVCDKCGYESPKWFGRCPVCGEWNSAKEFKLKSTSVESISQEGLESTGNGKPIPRFFDLVSALREAEIKRTKVGIESLDTLLNGGIVPGQVILLGGEPGVGKSTLALQICDRVASENKRAYYVSGEESVQQVALRAKRLNISNPGIIISSETQIEKILDGIDVDKTALLVIDSIQTLSSEDIDSPVGGVVQIRAVVEKVRLFSKKYGIPSLLIAHVTKEGLIAGPKLVEHVVDTVIYFEGERTTDFRILRVQKNRYGPSGELTIFQMTHQGLEGLSEDSLITYTDAPGNVFTSVFEGLRPINVQIQALVSRVKMASGRRIAHGVDIRKVIIISAVLSKHLNLPLDFHDIYLNVSGGINVTDPGCELAIAGAIVSSFLDVYMGDTLMVGEVALDGSVRSALNLPKRVENAKSLKISTIVIPKASNLEWKSVAQDSTSKLIKVGHVRELFELIVERKDGQKN